MWQISAKGLLSVVAGIFCLIAPFEAAPATNIESSTHLSLKPIRMALHGSREQEYFLYVPETFQDKSVILVDVHGISRNVEDHVDAFIPYAEEHGFVLISPIFTPEFFDDYQRLGRDDRGFRADLVLIAMIDEVRKQYHIADTKVLLFGYSGGGQFAHRFAMAYPEQVARVAIGAAGWYTMPTKSSPYPYGTRATTHLENVSFVPERYLEIPMYVLVGDQDIKRTSSLNQSARVDAEQGLTRLERARHWVEAMNSAAIARHMTAQVTIEVLPGGTHSFIQNIRKAAMGGRIFDFFFATNGSSQSRARGNIKAMEAGT